MADNSESDATPYPEEFILETDFTPKGDQPEAIRNLIDGYKNGLQWQTLLGVTGSGKSLDFDQQIILLNQDGLVEKVKIGEFVEKQLTDPQTINDTNYQNVTGAQIISFDPNDYEINLMKIIQVSKHKEDQLFQIELDDYSKIRVTKDHNCYKLINDDLKLVHSKELTVGDYLPTSNFLPEPQKPVVFIDLLEDENITNYLNIRSLILDNPIYVETTRKIVSQEYVAYGHKVNQILKGSPDRGLNQSLVQHILESLQISSYEARDKLNLITSGDSISPIIDINDEFLTFAGLYVAEGHITRSYILMSNSDKGLQYICKKFFTDIGLNYTIRNENEIQFNSSIMAEFFKKFGTNSYNKRIPNLIYNLSNDDLRIFMRALFDGDGWVEDGKVCYSSISEELVFDIKNLLLRFNITSRLQEKIVNWKGRDRKNFLLSISGQRNLSLYYNKISFSFDYKIKKLLDQFRNFRNTDVDLFPDSGGLIKEYRMKNGVSQRNLAKFLGCQRSYISLVENGKRNPSKHLMEKFALISNNHNLMNLLNFNFRRIVSIKKVKPSNGFVYDIAVNNNENFMAGSGNIFVHNTFTASRVINEINLPTLVMAPNKTLAAQLFAEFKTLFPKNAVEFFVSFYDYYQPEAYLPTKDLYIDKDFNINEEIEKMRNSTTRALAERRDVIVVASVSCIYNVGLPETYRSSTISIFIGMNLERDILLRRLVDIQYSRNEMDFKSKTFRAKGDRVEINPIYQDEGLRIEFFGDEIESIAIIDVLTGNVIHKRTKLTIYPATQYLTREEMMGKALTDIKSELEERLADLREKGNLVAAERLMQRTNYDLELLEQTGHCPGIENYSRHFDGRSPGDPPYTLMDHFPKDYFLIIDESHQSIPQIHGMYGGDFSRKLNLVNYGFRLPSAYDNRPLRFEEFERRMPTTLFLSATPADYELDKSLNVVEQIIRPTGLIDPEIQVKKSKNQIDDLIIEVEARIAAGERVLVTTLTKRMAENLSDYLIESGFKARYMHSDIDTLERVQILTELRTGEVDVLVGINLLREGLDLPEVSLVVILDADKQGFLRSTRSLIQIMGRAARNAQGKVILYADTISESMHEAITINNRRRKKQELYNKKHGITPKTIVKGLFSILETLKNTSKIPNIEMKDEMNVAELKGLIIDLTALMEEAATNLEFELAAELRDKIKELKQTLIVEQNS